MRVSTIEALCHRNSSLHRAHQGWRYLSAEDAPPDLAAGADAGETLPAGLARELLALGLL